MFEVGQEVRTTSARTDEEWSFPKGTEGVVIDVLAFGVLMKIEDDAIFYCEFELLEPVE